MFSMPGREESPGLVTPLEATTCCSARSQWQYIEADMGLGTCSNATPRYTRQLNSPVRSARFELLKPAQHAQRSRSSVTKRSHASDAGPKDSNAGSTPVPHLPRLQQNIVCRPAASGPHRQDRRNQPSHKRVLYPQCIRNPRHQLPP